MAPEGLQSAPEVQGAIIKEETDGSQLLRQLRRDLPALSPGEDLRHRGRVQGCHEHVFKEIQGEAT
ncbi:Hypothetical protein FKW44_013716 [Caligus rogercresseyi]|uniref:Uncharacterized protein n=1 Tax=Caligus rogercresseyi TaxID=217165 RepID=A0A7T8JZ89_CALRO|nr:Hypothetical protein FKW44_013716 [Caligus rogercresseyi]